MGLFAPAYGAGQVGESADESWFSVYGFGQISSLTEPQFPAPPPLPMVSLSGWGESGREKGFSFEIGQGKWH